MNHCQLFFKFSTLFLMSTTLLFSMEQSDLQLDTSQLSYDELASMIVIEPIQSIPIDAPKNNKNKTKKYHCPFCSYNVDTLSTFNRHFRDNHVFVNFLHVCPHPGCKNKMAGLRLIGNHHKMSHTNYLQNCDECKEIYKKKTSLITNMIQQIREKNLNEIAMIEYVNNEISKIPLIELRRN